MATERVPETPNSTENGHHDAPALIQDEGVLRDVLGELDRERSKRAELEAQIRKLTEDLSAERAVPKTQPQPETEEALTQKAFVAMETAVQGYQQLVDALTLGKPAIAAAAAQESASPKDKRRHQPTLPLHVVRLLEVMPWDPRAQEHIFGEEVVFEWQIFDTHENKWHNNLRHFPVLFKTIPVVNPNTDGGNIKENTPKDRSLLVFLAGLDKSAPSPSKHGVLTDGSLTLMYKIDDGYPLPQDGGSWEWVGGWRVDKRINPSVSQETYICDDHGWSYAFEAHAFITAAGNESDSIAPARDHATMSTGPKRNVRRRKWFRRRVLLDYHMASERTQQYLKVVAENARLSVTAAKINEQLMQTKMALTETEEKLLQAKATFEKQEDILRAVGVNADDVVVINEKTGDASSKVQDFLSKNEQVKELGSKITQWYKSARKTSEDLTSVDSGEEDAMSATKGIEESTPQKFPWKKLGRGGLIEKLARPSPGPVKARALIRSNSNGSNTFVTNSTASVDELKAERVGEES
jgi:hypothetical protein